MVRLCDKLFSFPCIELDRADINFKFFNVILPSSDFLFVWMHFNESQINLVLVLLDCCLQLCDFGVHLIDIQLDRLYLRFLQLKLFVDWLHYSGILLSQSFKALGQRLDLGETFAQDWVDKKLAVTKFADAASQLVLLRTLLRNLGVVKFVFVESTRLLQTFFAVSKPTKLAEAHLLRIGKLKVARKTSG
jgi:hypothetical protein